MRDANIFSRRTAMPRMSWAPRNLFNLWLRSLGSKSQEVTFKKSNLTMFQQRWKSKALIRAYHGDFINEKIFKRWYLPSTLPDVRSRTKTIGDDGLALQSFAMRREQFQQDQRKLAEGESEGLAPVGSLMLAEIERRIDVFIFRCCFAHSVYEARRLVIHGHVLLNGKRHQNANTRLAPGDMVSVEPSAIRFLKEKGQEDGDQKQLKESPSQDGEQENVDSTIGAVQEKAKKEESSDSDGLTPFNLPLYASPFIFIPAYAEVSFPTCSAIYVRHPTARPGYSEIPTPYDADGEVIRLTWEWYSKMRPRIRSKSQLARMPENRR